MNIWNFCEFHRYMVEKEYIRASDFNLNILQSPKEYRIDILPLEIKQEFKEKFEKHLDWLRPLDKLQRATGGFEAAINFMTNNDCSHLLGEFWETASDLDWSRNERIIDAVPELRRLISYKPAWTRV
jgi:hypothetical protein